MKRRNILLIWLVPVLTVWMIGDPGAPDRGTQDPAILDWCVQFLAFEETLQ